MHWFRRPSLQPLQCSIDHGQIDGTGGVAASLVNITTAKHAGSAGSHIERFLLREEGVSLIVLQRALDRAARLCQTRRARR